MIFLVTEHACQHVDQMQIEAIKRGESLVQTITTIIEEICNYFTVKFPLLILVLDLFKSFLHLQYLAQEKKDSG